MSSNQQRVFDRLNSLNIEFTVHHHPALPTIDDALPYWDKIAATHCKNLFFRNHKGNQHYLVIFHYLQQLNIRDLELRLKQGKLSFASEKRMEKYLGVKPGSVTPLGLINDEAHHVVVFIDKNLEKAETLSFHPMDNTATLVLSKNDFVRFLQAQQQKFSFLDLY